MKFRKLGQTNLEVSEIGFGGIPIQRITQEQVNEIIVALVKEKINFIDTAVSYTTSEEMLGIALKGYRKHFIIATKSMSRTYEAMKKDIEQSLQRLQTNYIDLYQCHFVRSKECYQQILAEDGAYKALLEAKASGKIHHIGITSHSADVLTAIIADNYFSTIQFPYNFLELQGEALFKQAKTLDIGVIVMKPLAGGVIKDYQASLKFILQNDCITLAIPGMASVDEVVKNAKVVNNIELTEEEIMSIANMRNKLANDFCHRCGYCLPCVKQIDIPTLFTLELYHNEYHLEKWAKTRYQSLLIKADSCINCGACEKRCPYHLAIRLRLKRLHKSFI